MQLRSRRVLLGLLACGMLAPATALAVPDPVFILGTGESSGTITLAGDGIKAGATAPSTFKCNKMNAVIAKAIPLKGRSFSYTGKLKGQAGTIVFKGTFNATMTKVTGSTKITRGSCSSRRTWTGKPLV